MENQKQRDLKRALKIGILCIGSYLVSYCMRNLLSVTTPEMTASGEFTKEFIGTLSSVYMLVYALGQLVNGSLGDRIKPKFMVSLGMSAAGIASILFALISLPFVQLLLFALMGFTLSMLRGPLVKTICENSRSEHAHFVCVCLSFVSFVGPLFASLLTMLFDWKWTFAVGGALSIVVGIFVFFMLSLFEKRGIIVSLTPTPKKNDKSGVSGIKNLGIFRLFGLHNFVFYMIVGMICEIATASISFWLPTYIAERLAFGELSGLLYSVISFSNSFTPFVAIFLLGLFKNNDIKMIRISFFSAAVLFVAVLLVKNPVLNLIFLALSLIAVRLSSTLLWGVYIPDQGSSGLVSTLNGFLDFTGYAAAAAANMVFSVSMAAIGWNGIVMMWIALPVIGLISSLFAKKKPDVSDGE